MKRRRPSAQDKDCWWDYCVVAIAVASCTFVTGAELEPTLVIYAKVTTMTADSTALGFGGSTVDHRISDEVLRAISPLGLAASLKAIEELSAGDTAQRAVLSRKLEALEYEAKRAFEQYDVVDARNRLAAAELERRWNEKLHEIEAVKEQLSGLTEERYSLSSEDEANIL